MCSQINDLRQWICNRGLAHLRSCSMLVLFMTPSVPTPKYIKKRGQCHGQSVAYLPAIGLQICAHGLSTGFVSALFFSRLIEIYYTSNILGDSDRREHKPSLYCLDSFYSEEDEAWKKYCCCCVLVETK